MYKISGTYCASLTPFNQDYTINKRLLLEHCNNLLSQKIDGIAIFGTTGEANSLSIKEKLFNSLEKKLIFVLITKKIGVITN